MKRLLLILLPALLAATTSYSQIVVSSDIFRDPESDIKIKLLDSLSNEPLVMASVYLQPKGDTTIMYFTLTDADGNAKLEKVVRGNYKLTAEYLGYKAYVKSFYFSKTVEELGTVKMVEDATLLEAATVTAIGNPIEIKQDTIVYNASMFRTAENAVLGDLLKKMPGFEVSDGGQVKLNGESVSKITVNGKTFFFDDPSMAVKNLPAKIVDKIKITEHKSDEEKATGISNLSAQKEKEMDISLKKEYEKGWFGNAKFAAGAPVSPGTDDPNMMVGGKDFMYNGNLMLSGYNEKDQVTIIANANNVPNMGANDMIFVFYDDSPTQKGRTKPQGGLTTSRQMGANINTSRIKGYDMSIMANYKGNLIEAESISLKNTFMENAPNMITNMESEDNYDEDAANVSLEFTKTDKKKVSVRILPKVTFSALERRTLKDMETSQVGQQNGSLLNTSSSRSYLESDYFTHRTDAYITVKDLGKKGRSLSFSAAYFISNDDAQSKEYSNTEYIATESNSMKDLYYKNRAEGYGGKLSVTYVEPVGKLWSISTLLMSNLSNNDVESNAYTRPESGSFVPGFSDKREYTVLDEYWSSLSENRYLRNTAQLLAQYKKEQTTVQFGASAEAVNNEIYTKSYGISRTTGKGEYLWNYSPFLYISHSSEKGAFIVARYNGTSKALSNSLITPVPDISNPTFISMGNIYLEPEFSNNFTLSANFNNKKTFAYFSGYLMVDNVNRNIVYANWFDEEGVQYNVPVNSKKAGNRASFSGQFGSIPLNEKKSFLFGASFSGTYSRGCSYQNINRIEGVDMDNFNYSSFMEWFWGNSAGDRFYSGESGFKESLTKRISLSGGVNLRYKGERFTSRVSFSATRDMVEYSLNKDANMYTWDYYTYWDAQYDTKTKFNFISSLRYRFYDGYADGYGEPVLSWDLEAYKTVKAFTFGIKLNDIFNQTTSFRRTTQPGYVEDSYRNVIGRHFLLSLTFNFGKMNSAKSRSANNAMFNMMM